jgi:hypothetical protein
MIGSAEQYTLGGHAARRQVPRFSGQAFHNACQQSAACELTELAMETTIMGRGARIVLFLDWLETIVGHCPYRLFYDYNYLFS